MNLELMDRRGKIEAIEKILKDHEDVMAVTSKMFGNTRKVVVIDYQNQIGQWVFELKGDPVVRGLAFYDNGIKFIINKANRVEIRFDESQLSINFEELKKKLGLNDRHARLVKQIRKKSNKRIFKMSIYDTKEIEDILFSLGDYVNREVF